MQDGLITTDELGARLRLKPDTIISWARRGRIPAHRLSRKVIRFRLSEVIAALGTATTRAQAQDSVPGPIG